MKTNSTHGRSDSVAGCGPASVPQSAFRTPHSALRTGFTVIELLVVIAIIAVLVGLLGAGAQMVRQRARELRMRNDISQLSTQVQEFKNKYQVPYMPSLIVLREDGLYGTHANPTVAALERRSRADLRRIWPRLQAQVDWNLNGVIDLGDGGAFILEGDQCLVFFLGGPNGLGFSSNKTNPMAPTVNREAPLFDFPTPRLRVVAHPSGGNSPFPSFIDEFGERPYLYFCDRTGTGYGSDCPSSNQTDTVGPWTATGNPVVPYRELNVPKFYSRDGFQIICAGPDRQFGSPTAPAAFMTWDSATGAPYVNNATDPGRDDFSNFHPSRLGSGL